ncbi:MAG: hypothetical protein LBL93_05615 [Ruminococcus sp.]|nr:hypothetical protein [Ruminococcus sp.]
MEEYNVKTATLKQSDDDDSKKKEIDEKVLFELFKSYVEYNKKSAVNHNVCIVGNGFPIEKKIDEKVLFELFKSYVEHEKKSDAYNFVYFINADDSKKKKLEEKKSFKLLRSYFETSDINNIIKLDHSKKKEFDEKEWFLFLIFLDFFNKINTNYSNSEQEYIFDTEYLMNDDILQRLQKLHAESLFDNFEVPPYNVVEAELRAWAEETLEYIQNVKNESEENEG